MINACTPKALESTHILCANEFSSLKAKSMGKKLSAFFNGLVFSIVAYSNDFFVVEKN